MTAALMPPPKLDTGLPPCHDNPRLWFDPPSYPAAIVACGRCPLLADCRTWGAGMHLGVWGAVVRDVGRPS
jgi:hypothetical protein